MDALLDIDHEHELVVPSFRNICCKPWVPNEMDVLYTNLHMQDSFHNNKYNYYSSLKYVKHSVLVWLWPSS